MTATIDLTHFSRWVDTEKMKEKKRSLSVEFVTRKSAIVRMEVLDHAASSVAEFLAFMEGCHSK